MAQQETIKFTIRQDGTVTETVMGITGPNCEKLTERIEEKLGVVSFKESTSDYYNKVKNLQTQNVSL